MPNLLQQIPKTIRKQGVPDETVRLHHALSPNHRKRCESVFVYTPMK